MTVLTETSTNTFNIGHFLVVTFWTTSIFLNDFVPNSNYVVTSATARKSETIPDNLSKKQESDLSQYQLDIYTLPTLTQTDLHQTRAEFSRSPSPLNFSSVLPPTLHPLDLVNDSSEPFKHLENISTSPSSGYIKTWGYTGFPKETEQMIKELSITELVGSVNDTLHVPKNHVVMVSFNYHGLKNNDKFDHCTNPYVTLVNEHGDTEAGERRNVCPTRDLSTTVYNHSLTVVYAYDLRKEHGFKLLFSFHPVSQAPHKVKSGLWNCSVPHYASFKQHVHCNLEVECEGGEDEGGHCSFQ
ncbi:hypothetical protein BaRGS_00037391 [Batillaria attramentaria]|uniref:Uncharacterized protein n=1 Tax=Batillaria attramentaria TaxID=370345 RepID=A0ABD0J8U7_9CAEN